MLRDNNDSQTELEMVCIETLVPDNHLLRKINRYTDFKIVRDKLKSFYCENNGRPAIDPESGFLMRDGKEECLAYLYHRTVDGQHNIITDVHVTPGSLHDSILYISRLDLQIDKFNFDV